MTTNIKKSQKTIGRRLQLFFKYDWWKIFRELFLWVNIFLMMFPLFFMIVSSTKSNGEFLRNPFSMPENFTKTIVENYRMALTGLVNGVQYTPFTKMLLNTSITTFGSLVLMVACALLAGYALARKNFVGKNAFVIFVLIIQIVPFFGYIMPMYLFAQTMNLTNSLAGLIPVLVAVSMPSAIILIQGFYKSFPVAVEEAALIDGCNEFKKFIHIVLPMSRGIIASMAIINFMGYWNEVGISSLMLNDIELTTISIGVLSTNTQTGMMNYAYVMALLTLSALPNMLFFTIFQKSITRGISLGSVKG